MDSGQINTCTALILYDESKITLRDKLWYLFTVTLSIENQMKQYHIREVFFDINLLK
jgi:hypothetical protein